MKLVQVEYIKTTLGVQVWILNFLWNFDELFELIFQFLEKYSWIEQARGSYVLIDWIAETICYK